MAVIATPYSRIRGVENMTSEQRLRWVIARQKMFKAVLRSPISTDSAKEKARKKLEAAARYQ